MSSSCGALENFEMWIWLHLKVKQIVKNSYFLETFREKFKGKHGLTAWPIFVSFQMSLYVR